MRKVRNRNEAVQRAALQSCCNAARWTTVRRIIELCFLKLLRSGSLGTAFIAVDRLAHRSRVAWVGYLNTVAVLCVLLSSQKSLNRCLLIPEELKLSFLDILEPLAMSFCFRSATNVLVKQDLTFVLRWC